MNSIEKAIKKNNSDGSLHAKKWQQKNPVELSQVERLIATQLDKPGRKKSLQAAPIEPLPIKIEDKSAGISQPNEQTQTNNWQEDATIEAINRDEIILTTTQKLEKKVSRQIDIDMDNLKKMGFLLPQGDFSVLHDEYRKIKRPLIDNIRKKDRQKNKYVNLIQVTSASHDEGKTFSAINLAIAFAMEMDLNVLLVDADVINSSVTKILVNKLEKGLTDYLAGEVQDLSEVLLATNIPKLKILPAGKANYLSPELLNSEYMAQLISEFSERYDNRVVIIDTSPILFSNEAIILANKVGQIVFVVEQNKTEQSKVIKALDLIEGNSLIGLLMNKSRTSKRGAKNGYH